MELISNFDFVKIEEDGDTKEEILTNIKQGLAELNLYKAGKMEFRNANALIDDL
jgi:hypothetical protein